MTGSEILGSLGIEHMESLGAFFLLVFTSWNWFLLQYPKSTLLGFIHSLCSMDYCIRVGCLELLEVTIVSLPLPVPLSRFLVSCGVIWNCRNKHSVVFKLCTHLRGVMQFLLPFLPQSTQDRVFALCTASVQCGHLPAGSHTDTLNHCCAFEACWY